MRQHLMESFDEIYVLDLHGNTLKKEVSPDGGKDENVFEIQQGVAISFLVKKTEKGKHKCRIFHASRWGLENGKSDWLLSNDVTSTEWAELKPHSPFYFFIPKEGKYRKTYENFWTMKDIFPINNVGIVTARDNFVMDLDKNKIESRIEMFRDSSRPDSLFKEKFGLKDTSTFDLGRARKRISEIKEWKQYFTEILVRPFDKRHIYYEDSIIERPLHKIMDHMIKKNLAIVTSKQVLREFRHAFVTNQITNFNLLDTAGRFGSGYLFPLYLYKGRRKMDNINSSLIALLQKAYGAETNAKNILFYVYAILYSNCYRIKYTEFLKTDFPKIPFTSSYELFKKLEELGKTLVALHLLQAKELDAPVAKFRGESDNTVQTITYDTTKGRIYINNIQYFEGITKEVWEYEIGGYQVLSKWLKYRKRSKLSFNDIKHFCRIVVAIKKTIETQNRIDELYSEIELNIIPSQNTVRNAGLDKFAK